MVSDEKTAAADSRSSEMTPGEILTEGRERAGLTQEQVAKELYMTLTKVRALESDDYRHMGPDTFIRGYLRSYAALVKLDATQLIAAYDRYAQKNGLIAPSLPTKQEPTSKPLWQFVAMIVAALLVVWLISVWFFDNRKKPEYAMPATALPTVESIQVSNSAESTASTSSSAASSESEQTSLMIAAPVDSLATTTSGSSVGESASSSSEKSFADAAKLDEIVFTFSEECWLEVSDSRGDALMTDLQPAGSRLALYGIAPFDVKLGNAPATRIELNNEKITVVPALGTNVLKLKIDKSTVSNRMD